MNVTQATDEFLFYLQVEKNYSVHTITGYAHNLGCFDTFLNQHHRSCDLDDISKSTCPRFILDQVLRHQIKPRTLKRRISCLKLLNQFYIKENMTKSNFTDGIEALKADVKLPVYMSLLELQQLSFAIWKTMPVPYPSAITSCLNCSQRAGCAGRNSLI